MKYLLIERMTRLGLAFFMGIFAARILGEIDYGTLALALTIGNLALVFANLGIDGLLVREYTRFPSPMFLDNIFKLQFKISIFIFLLFQAVFLIFPTIDWILFVLITCQVLVIPFYNLGFFLEAQSDFKHYGLSLIIAVVLTAALRLLILSSHFFEDKLLAIVCTYAFEMLLAGLFFKRFIKFKMTRSLFSKPRKHFILTLLSKSKYSFFSAIIGFLLLKLDLILIAAFIDNSLISLGDIAFSMRLQDALLVVMFSYVQVQSPRLFNSVKNNSLSEYSLITKKLMITIMVFCALYLFFAYLFIEDVVHILVGPEFIDVPEVFLARNLIFFGLIFGQLAHVYILVNRNYEMIFYKSLFFVIIYLSCLSLLFLFDNYLIFIKIFGLLTLITNLLFLIFYYNRSLRLFIK